MFLLISRFLLIKVKEESEKAGLKLNIQRTKTVASSPTTWWQIDRETVTNFIFLGSKIPVDSDFKTLAPWNKAMTNPDNVLKSRHHFANKSPSSQSYGLSSSHAWMWELDHKEGWAPKTWCFWIVALEKTLESLLNCKEIKTVNPKGNQPWIFTGRTDAEA